MLNEVSLSSKSSSTSKVTRLQRSNFDAGIVPGVQADREAEARAAGGAGSGTEQGAGGVHLRAEDQAVRAALHGAPRGRARRGADAENGGRTAGEDTRGGESGATLSCSFSELDNELIRIAGEFT